MASYGEMTLVDSMRFLAESQASVAHNLANANTSSFKRSTAIATDRPDRFQQLLGHLMPTISYGERSDFSQGTLRPTNEKMNIAIDGDQFFRVKARNGETFYTRKGELLIDRDGFLALNSGHRLLGAQDQEIQVGQIGELAVSSNGQVKDGSPNSEGDILGQIALWSRPEGGELSTARPGLFRDLKAIRPQADPLGQIRQGSLEQSNVEPITELVRMIEIQRKFQSASKAMTSIGRIQQSFTAAMNR